MTDQIFDLRQTAPSTAAGAPHGAAATARRAGGAERHDHAGRSVTSEHDLEWFSDTFRRLVAAVGGALRGQDDVVGFALIAVLSDGHLLIEGPPGVGKTTLARTIAESVAGTWNRIQFSADLRPGDVLGTNTFDAAGDRFRPGPVFANVVIADDITRGAAMAQSALLEVMEERRVTVDGVTHLAPRPFAVVATQNVAGVDADTGPLSASTRDRFLVKLNVGYPDTATEIALAVDQRRGEGIEPVVGLDDVERMMQLAAGVRCDEQVAAYVVALAQSTRRHPDVQLGISPRAVRAVLRGAQTMAAAARRPYVIVDDVKRLAVPALAHRLVLTPAATARGVDGRTLVAEIVSQLPVPGCFVE